MSLTYSEQISTTSLPSGVNEKEEKTLLDSTIENVKDTASSVAEVVSSTAQSAVSTVQNAATVVGSKVGLTEIEQESEEETKVVPTTITTQISSLSQPDAFEN